MPTVRTNDIETYYERRGAGPAVVFVHGALVDHTEWQAQLDALTDEYTAVAYDVRGHGRTGGSARDTYSVDLFVDDLDALLTALDLDEVVLCGHSMGGCIAQTYAARHPERVAGLVLVSTFTPHLPTMGDRLQLGLLRVTVPPARLVGYERVERAMVWLQERMSRGASGDYDAIEAIRERGPAISTEEFEKIVGALVAFPKTTVDYEAISVPTLVLYGANEPSFIRRQAGILGSLIQDASVRVVPDAGHAPTLDDPTFVAESIREILSNVVAV